MPGYELDIRIDARSDDVDALASALTDESQRVRTRLYAKFGLRPHSSGQWACTQQFEYRLQ